MVAAVVRVVDGRTGNLVAGTEVAARIDLLVNTAVEVVAVGLQVVVVVAVAVVSVVSVAVHTIQVVSWSGLHLPRFVLTTNPDQFALAITILHSPPPRHPSFLWE